MPQEIDITGRVFHRLTVLRKTNRYSGLRAMWKCRCACGQLTYVISASLRAGSTRSCGCLQKEIVTSHGKSGSIELSSYKAMKDRCENPNSPNYYNYGGRGIKICKRWQSPKVFLRDMGKRPSLRYTLDRIDTNGDYTPKNCRWATKKTQANNTRNNIVVLYKGKKIKLRKLLRRAGNSIDPKLVTKRLERGWSTERAIETPKRNYKL